MKTDHEAASKKDFEIVTKTRSEVPLQEGALQSAIFNSTNFSSIATDANGVIQIFNVGAERMLGYTAAEVMNKITPADISDPQEVIARAQALTIELETPILPGFEALVFKASRGIEDIYELTYIRKDGSRFPAVVSVTALRDDQDAIIGYLLIGTDNTARKLHQEMLLEREIELAAHNANLIMIQEGMEVQRIELALQAEELRLVSIVKDQLILETQDTLNLLNLQKLELVESNRLLEVSSQAKSVFMANMNHELRTPLNSIIGFSEVLQDQLYGAINAAQADCVDDIISSGKHLLSLINDILDLTKIESGKMELQLGIFSLRGILDNALDMLMLKAQKGGICLSMDLAPKADMDIEADERKLKQILYNLLSNAVKFTPMGGTVSVVVEREGDLVKISVVDTGMGIREEDVPKLFQPFTQLVSADDKFGGTGLGLALTKQLVELHGGRVCLTSVFGSGSTFSFTIPLTQNAEYGI